MSGVLDPNEVLAERARRLARAVAADGLTLDEVESGTVLVIRLGDERMGVALDYITEVHRAVRLTPIPGAGAPVAGVKNILPLPWG